MSPGKMLCFFGSNLEKNRSGIQRLIERDYLEKEDFKGAYSLTPEGFQAMKTCDQ